jgi:hypothetical protein
MQYLYEVVGSHIFYELAPTLEQMFEDLVPQIKQLAPVLGNVFSVDSNITFGDIVGGGSNGSNSGAGEQHDDEL